MFRCMKVMIAVLAVAVLGFGAGAAELKQDFLDNGLELLLKESHGGPMVASIITVGAGSRYEDESSFGASHFLEHMVFNGTTERSREDINEGIKDYGGYINAFTRREYTCYILLIPREYLREGLSIQADMLFNSVLPPEEFEKERLVVIEEIRKSLDSGSYRDEMSRNQAVLAGTPYAHPVLGTPETIMALDRDAVIDYYHEFYQPAKCRLFLVGDFETRAARRLLDEIYGNYPSGQPLTPPVVDSPQVLAPTLHAHLSESGQASIEMNWIAPPVSAGGYQAQLALADLLSDRHRSPLRAPEGVNWDLGLGIELFRDFSILRLSLEAGDEDPALVLDAFGNQFARLAEWMPTAERVAEAAHSLRIEDIFLQDTYHYYAMMKSAELHIGGFDLLGSYADDLRDLGRGEVRAALEQSLLAAPPQVVYGHKPEADAQLPDSVLAKLSPPVGTHLAVDGKEAGIGKGRKVKRARRQSRKDKVLDNGLRVILKTDPSSEVFAAHLLIRGRSIAEPEGKAGMVSLAQRLLTAGTAESSEEEIAARLSAIGAKLKVADNPWMPFDNYYSREDFSFIRLECLDESSGEALELLAELLGSAAYPEAAFQRERGRMLGEGSRGLKPGGQARSSYYATLFPGGLRGRPLDGDASSLMAISARDLRDFHSTYFTPGQMILSVVSGNPTRSTLRQIRNSLGRLSGEERSLPATELFAGSSEISVPMDKEQVALLAARLLGPGESDEIALPVLAKVLSSRLALELREKQGLAYSVGAGLRSLPGLAPGEANHHVLSLSISTGKDNRDRARAGLEAELSRLVSEPPTEEEIFRAVNGSWGRELMRNLSRIHQAYVMGLTAHLGEDPFAASEGEASLQRALKPEDLASLAEKTLLSGDWIWVQAGGGLD